MVLGEESIQESSGVRSFVVGVSWVCAIEHVVCRRFGGVLKLRLGVAVGEETREVHSETCEALGLEWEEGVREGRRARRGGRSRGRGSRRSSPC